MGAFQISYDNHANYPLNLLHSGIYAGHLKALKARLDTESERLCIPERGIANVCFRDFVRGTCMVLDPSSSFKANP